MSYQANKLLRSEFDAKDEKENETVAVSSFEILLERVGANGRYQWTLLIVFLIPLSLFYSIAMFNVLLLLSTPKHHCYVPGRNDTNFTIAEWTNLTIPWEEGTDGRMHLSQCKMNGISRESELNKYDRILSVIYNSSSDCLYGWEYDDSSWKDTPITMFDWVCEKSQFVTIIFSANMAGSAVGTLLLSIISDRLGRKPVFYVALLLNLIFGNALIFASSFPTFVVLRFLASSAFFTVYQLPYIIVLELCNVRLRMITTYTTWLMFIVSNAALSLAGWYFNDWKTFLLVTQLPLAIFIFYWRLIPESPRWLLSRGKIAECEEVMTKIAVRNGKKFTKEMRQLMEVAYGEEKTKVPVSKILASATLTKHFIIITVTEVLALVCAVSFNINVHNMKGNIFINYLYLRSFELPGDIFGTVSSLYVGRRLTTVLCMIFASMFALVGSFLISEGWSLITMCGVTKIFLRASIYTCYSQTGELFPTQMRSSAYGIIGIVGLAATVSSPSLIAIGKTNPRLPYYIICGICLTATLVASFLPETFGNPLPQTIREAKQIGKGQSYFSFNPKGTAAIKIKNDNRKSCP